MRRALFALLAAAMSVPPAGGANAQSSGAAQPGATAPSEPTEAQSPNITVQEDRLVCRARVRTATRMGTNRVCRTQREWAEERARTQEQDIEAVADKLEILGSAPLVRSDTGLGPR
jgi:hypothetical protein